MRAPRTRTRRRRAAPRRTRKRRVQARIGMRMMLEKKAKRLVGVMLKAAAQWLSLALVWRSL